MQPEDKIIGECTYHLRKANFIEAKAEAFKLTTLLKGCFTNDGKAGFDIGQFLANLNSQEMEGVERFICKYATVTNEDGTKVLLQNPKEANDFFNEHREQYFEFIFEGVKFHFLGFLPNGIASKVNTLGLETLSDLVT
ncbi:putative phage tail assembly chaperone [Orbus wheelerorum]|uniref:putative phage tail assembly chaperone n=1 Tax=Orbus wheelerorum TaxID=3074111 RepID=UPI00370D0B96